MAQDPNRLAQFKYAAMSNLVLQADRRFQARARVVDLLTQELARQRVKTRSAVAEIGADPVRALQDQALIDSETAAVSRLEIRLSDAQRVLNDGALQTADYVA
jgi:hypothetical protein